MLQDHNGTRSLPSDPKQQLLDVRRKARRKNNYGSPPALRQFLKSLQVGTLRNYPQIILVRKNTRGTRTKYGLVIRQDDLCHPPPLPRFEPASAALSQTTTTV